MSLEQIPSCDMISHVSAPVCLDIYANSSQFGQERAEVDEEIARRPCLFDECERCNEYP